MTSTTELRQAFANPSAQRKQAMAMHAKATAQLRVLIPEAVKAGISKSEIARLAGMSRQSVIQVLANSEGGTGSTARPMTHGGNHEYRTE
jgi:hypothetical protein